jgi:hypothetical protein
MDRKVIQKRRFKSLFNKAQVEKSKIDVHVCITTVATFIIMLATVLGSFSTYLQWKELRESDRTNRSALVASQRAWIAPINALLEGEIELGKPFHLQVVYENTGKTPAINIQVNYEYGVTDVPKARYAEPDIKFPIYKTCAIIENWRVPGFTVYPSATQKYSEHFYIDKRVTSQLARNKIFYIQGCFKYRTFDEIHQSPFCFYIDPNDGVPPHPLMLKTCSTSEAAN